jgi:LmbE family N-acetylglucosaminyl deacetylase
VPPRLRLLCIGGHPADTFDGAGGTLAHHVQDGDEVTVVALTAGTRIHDVVISDSMRARDRIPGADELTALMAGRAEVKADEVRRACGFLGITDVRFFGYDDAVLTLREELILRMASLIREVRPDVIITHHPNELGEYGNHHAMTAQLVLNGIGAAHGVGMGDPNPPHRVAQVFFTTHALVMPSNVLSGPLPWYPDLIVDITDVVEAKVRALDAMRSQQYGGDYARKTIEMVDGAMGSAGGVAYGEGFVTYLPNVSRTFPVSDWLLQRASESEADLMHRRTRIIATKVDLPD